MWRLMDWYGSAIVALLVVTLMSLWAGTPSYSYVFGSVLNANALLLLFAWNYHVSEEEKSEDEDGRPKLPILYIQTPIGNNGSAQVAKEGNENLRLPSVPVSTITADSYESSDLPDPTSNFVSMSNPSASFASSSSASSSSVFVPPTGSVKGRMPTFPIMPPASASSDDTDDDDGIFDDTQYVFFCWGFTIYYSCFFLLALFVSTVTFLQSCFEGNLNYEDEESYFYVANYFSDEGTFKKITFLISFGAYFAACCLSFFNSSRVEQIHIRFGIMALSLCCAVGSCLLAFQCFFLTKASSMEEASFVSLLQLKASDQEIQRTSIYVGEAWTTGDSMILESNDDNEYCTIKDKWSGEIPVSLTVFWGGEWACPDNSDTFCESTIQTSVSCDQWTQFSDISGNADETGGDKTGVTIQNYIQYRYHDFGIDDDVAYERDQEPSFTYWNRPTESIVGTCDGTCVARSQSRLSHIQENWTLFSHIGYLCIGMGVVFLVWPFFELWRHLKETLVPSSSNAVMAVNEIL